MSDWLDVVRAANPVPRPRPFDADVRQRINAAPARDDPAASPRGLEGAAGPAPAACGLFDGPAAVHAPATPTLAAGVAVAGGVLVLATGMSDRADANPRAFELTWTKPAA